MYIDRTEREHRGEVAREEVILDSAQDETINKIPVNFLEYLLYLHKAGSIRLSAHDVYEIECEINPEL